MPEPHYVIIYRTLDQRGAPHACRWPGPAALYCASRRWRMRSLFIIVQAASFVGLAAVLLLAGDTRLAAAQALLAAVTVLVYSA